MSKTALEFWKAYDHFLNQNISNEIISNETERLRFRCMLGFVALDASLSYFWQEEIIPDWDGFMSLVSATLVNETDLQRLVKLSKGHFQKSQWVSSLRFIENTGEPERFAPNFADIACALLLLKPKFSETSILLYELQKIRNKTLHTAKGFNRQDALNCQNLMAQFRESMTQLSPVFLSVRNTSPLRRAA